MGSINNPSIYDLVKSGRQAGDYSLNLAQITIGPFAALLDAKRPPRCPAPSWPLGSLLVARYLTGTEPRGLSWPFDAS